MGIQKKKVYLYPRISKSVGILHDFFPIYPLTVLKQKKMIDFQYSLGTRTEKFCIYPKQTLNPILIYLALNCNTKREFQSCGNKAYMLKYFKNKRSLDYQKMNMSLCQYMDSIELTMYQ